MIPCRQVIVYYLGMVNSPAYCQHSGVSLYVGAAFKKMAGVIMGLKHSRVNAQLLSLPFLDNANSPFMVQQCVLSEDGFKAIYFTTFRNRICRKFFGSLSLAWFSLTSLSQDDIVLVYNHAPEYFLFLCLLRFRGISAYHDIEDVPISSDNTIEGFVERLFFRLTFLLTCKRKIVVSRQAANLLKLRNYLVINGVFTNRPGCIDDAGSKWTNLLSGGRLCIHYGGTLCAETGLDLFIKALNILDESYTGSRPIAFFVSGIGNIGRVSDLANCLINHRIKVSVSPKAPLAQYENIVSLCHVSLSLRSPNAPISSTTFPSKVIEASSRGLALITTDVSDMRQVYDDRSAFFLSGFDPHELSNLISLIASDSESIYATSCAGRDQVNKRFSPEVVGKSLKSFLRISC